MSEVISLGPIHCGYSESDVLVLDRASDTDMIPTYVIRCSYCEAAGKLRIFAPDDPRVEWDEEESTV